MIWITTILLVCSSVAHLLFDLHKQKVKHPIVHWVSALLVCVVSVALGFINQWITEYPWWRFTFYSLMIHLVFFDPVWNLFHGEAWYYSGTPSNPNRAFTDKIWDKVPPLGQLLFRFVFLFLGYSVYYHWDKIISS